MINVILAIDEEDHILGGFYSDCLRDFENFKTTMCTLSYIRSNALNEASVLMTVPGGQRFVFLAYSHGSENELLSGGVTPYISNSINVTAFKGALFYTCSCSTGKKLGYSLIENECTSYIGYKEKFEIWDFNRQPFVECANYGYKLFTQGENIESIIVKMKEKYDEHIDNYTNDFFGAAHLLANKNALLALGSMDFSLKHFKA